MIQLIIILLVMIPNVVFSDQKDGVLEIRNISDSVYLHTSYMKLPNIGYFPSNGLIVLDGTNAYMVDTPWQEEDAKVLVDWIEYSGFTLKASISTHFHDDRTSGIRYLNDHSIKTYASALTNQLLESIGGEKATVTFEGNEFSLLKGVLEAYYPGAGHTQDNIVVWLPKVRILFGGCLIRNLSVNRLGNIVDASLGDWAVTVKNVLEKFPEIGKVVPGHGSIGGAELLTHTIQLTNNANSNN